MSNYVFTQHALIWTHQCFLGITVSGFPLGSWSYLCVLFALFLSQVVSGYCGISSGSWCHMRVPLFILQSLQRRGSTSRMPSERPQGWSTPFRCDSLKLFAHGMSTWSWSEILSIMLWQHWSTLDWFIFFKNASFQYSVAIKSKERYFITVIH